MLVISTFSVTTTSISFGVELLLQMKNKHKIIITSKIAPFNLFCSQQWDSKNEVEVLMIPRDPGAKSAFNVIHASEHQATREREREI